MLEINSQGVVKASGDLADFARKAEEAEQGADKLKGSAGGLDKSAVAAAASVALLSKAVYDLAKSYIAFTKQAISVYSHFEQMELGLTAMVGSARKGKELFEELRVFSNETTLGVDTLANAASQLLGLGVGVDKINARLTQLGNIAGGVTEKFNRLVDIYVRIQATGKAYGQWVNQLSALTGISWRKVLQDMGVTGLATADDITRAFEKMTAEGEKFHGRMDAIIDTIEGKEGFIRDTMSELYALWAETTGQAGLYKFILDAVYDNQYKVLLLLKDINGNPLMQALITGGMVALITAVGTAFAVYIIPRLGMVIKQLAVIAGFKAIIAPQTLIIAGVTAAIAGAAAGVYRWKKAQDELKKSIEAANNEIRYQTHYADGQGSTLYDAYGMLIGEQKTKRGTLLEEFEKAQKSEEKWRAMINRGNDSVRVYLEWENARKEVKRLNEELTETDRLITELTNKQSGYKKPAEGSLLDTFASLNKLFGSTDAGKKANEIKALQDMIAEANRLGSIVVDKETGLRLIDVPGEKEKIAAIIKYAEDELAKFNKKQEEERSAGSYFLKGNDRLAGIFGQTKQGQIAGLQEQIRYVSQELKLADMAGNTERVRMATTAMEMLTESLKELTKAEEIGNKFVAGNDLLKQMYDATKQGQKDEIKQRLEYARQELALAKNSGDAEREKQAITVITELRKSLEEVTDSNKTLADHFREWTDGLKKSGGMGTVAGYAMDAAVSKSSEAQDFMQGFSQGGVWGGIISAVAGAFMDVAQDMEGFDMVVAPLHDLLEKLTPTIEVIVRVLGTMNARINNSIEPFLDIVNDLVTELEPLLDAMSSTSHILGIIIRALGLVTKAINTALMPVIKALANVFEFLFGWLDDLFGDVDLENQKKDEVETLKELNNEYKTLMETMRENEQYYLERKRQLEAETYTKNVLGVNDMILTPHGNFSTSPEDTILAMKHPEKLSGSGELKVIVNDYGGNNVDVQKNGFGELIINISKKVAADFASGKNGWESAMAAQQLRVAGRRVNA